MSPGQEFVDTAVEMSVDDFGDGVGEVGVGIDAGELAGFDQRGDDGPVVAATVRAGEESILPVQRDGANGALDDIGVDLDATVIEEAYEPLPMIEAIADDWAIVEPPASCGRVLSSQLFSAATSGFVNRPVFGP